MHSFALYNLAILVEEVKGSGAGGRKARALPPVIHAHIHEANHRNRNGVQEHLLDVICEYNMVQYNRRRHEAKNRKPPPPLRPEEIPERPKAHALHQPEMHFSKHHRDTTKDNVE